MTVHLYYTYGILKLDVKENSKAITPVQEKKTKSIQYDGEIYHYFVELTLYQQGSFHLAPALRLEEDRLCGVRSFRSEWPHAT